MFIVPHQLENRITYSIKKSLFHVAVYTNFEGITDNHVEVTDNAIVYVMEGQKEIEYDGTRFLIREKELFMLPKGRYLMSEYIPGDGCFMSVMLFCNDDHLLEILKSISDMVKFNTKSGDANDSPLYILQASQRLSLFFRSLLETQWRNDDIYQELLRNKIKELVLILLSESETRSQSLSFLQHVIASPVVNLKSVINEHLYNRMSLQELARTSGMSLSSFKRAFYEQYKSTPMQWLNEKRLEKAMLLIKHTPTPISEIAYECGFDSYIHFSRRFKARYGYPAKYFREKIL